MIRLLTLLLFCLLISGCGRSLPDTPPQPPEVARAIPEAVIPESRETLQVFPLEQRKVQGMQAVGNQLLLLSGHGSTTLTLLDSETLTPTVSTVLDFELSPKDPSLQPCGEGLSFFDPSARETVLLDSQLQEVRRIRLPGTLSGSPVLSQDGRHLYYCTTSDVRVWDLESGIRRCVKEMAFESQTMAAVLRNGSILQCRILDNGREKTLFFSGENGQLIREYPGIAVVQSVENRYYAQVPAGFLRTPVTGSDMQPPQMLISGNLTAESFFLPVQNALVAVSHREDQQVQLEYYDLASGSCRALLVLSGHRYPSAITAIGDNTVYILTYDPDVDQYILYRWNTQAAAATHTGSSHLVPCRTADDPDSTGLARCQALADRIGQRYGIQVLVGETAAAVQPWDYTLEPEYQVPILEWELDRLEQALSRYPEGFLEEGASHFSGLTICLVRSIRQTADPEPKTGLQFLNGSHAYIAITPGPQDQQALNHQLFHVIETRILSESKALDHWDQLNPSGFRYDYNYAANAIRNSGIYLFPGEQAFVDTYSMSFPKEDRARVMEYAMMPNQEALFRSEVMQKKLNVLCAGIRDAYDLEDYGEPLPWEQYLE